jgi:hypothetical protein
MGNKAQENHAMNNTKTYSFGELFGSVWSTFKSNYGLCLGITVIFLVVYVIFSVINAVLMGTLSSDESGTLAAFVTTLFAFFTMGVIVFPICSYMGFWLIQRTRGGERSQRGRYGTIVAIALLTQLCFLPGQVLQQLGDPGGGVQLHLIPKLIGAGFQQGIAKEVLDDAIKTDLEKYGELKKDSPNAKERHEFLDPLQKTYDEKHARFNELQEKMEGAKGENSPGMMLLAFLLTLAAVIFIYFWSPWAMYAALDPAEESTSTGQALVRGRALARQGGAWNIWLVPIVITVIMLVTTAACCLPGLFFGWPLAFAVAPGMYMCLRGERNNYLNQVVD